MADTQRTRSAILTLFADNNTGQVSAQDLRDFTVTIMNSEFMTETDFWHGPNEQYIANDRQIRGWVLQSQVIDSAVSFGGILVQTFSNTWRRADATELSLNCRLGVAGDSYLAAETSGEVLLKGVVFHSLASARLSSFTGQPVYLISDVLASVSVTSPTTYSRYVGCVLHNDSGTTMTGTAKFYFDPDWSVTGL